MIVGGERRPGDKRVSSTWGGCLSNFTSFWLVGFFRSTQSKMNAMDNAIVAIPPTTPVGEMRWCGGDPKMPAHRRLLHLSCLQR